MLQPRPAGSMLLVLFAGPLFAEEPRRVDAVGDPLPAGTSVRLGTQRLSPLAGACSPCDSAAGNDRHGGGSATPPASGASLAAWAACDCRTSRTGPDRETVGKPILSRHLSGRSQRGPHVPTASSLADDVRSEE